MRNTGKTLPTRAQVEELVVAVREVFDKVGPHGVQLTTNERRRSMKFRTGGERIVGS